MRVLGPLVLLLFGALAAPASASPLDYQCPSTSPTVCAGSTIRGDPDCASPGTGVGSIGASVGPGPAAAHGNATSWCHSDGTTTRSWRAVSASGGGSGTAVNAFWGDFNSRTVSGRVAVPVASADARWQDRAAGCAIAFTPRVLGGSPAAVETGCPAGPPPPPPAVAWWALLP